MNKESVNKVEKALEKYIACQSADVLVADNVRYGDILNLIKYQRTENKEMNVQLRAMRCIARTYKQSYKALERLYDKKEAMFIKLIVELKKACSTSPWIIDGDDIDEIVMELVEDKGSKDSYRSVKETLDVIKRHEECVICNSNNDEKGAGGIWDLAGEICEVLMIGNDHEEQDTIYNIIREYIECQRYCPSCGAWNDENAKKENKS